MRAMAPPMALLHSPAVGPSTWAPVARCLRARGVDVVAPDLRSTGRAGPPYWPRVSAAVADAVTRLGGSDAVLLVAHSNAGLLLPPVADGLARPVAGAVFVDAGLPADHGDTAVAPPVLLERLRALADADGLLPRWSDWWTPEDLAALLPDPATRAEVVADQPRLPLDYFEQALPVPPSWADVACAYVQFSPAYDDHAARARRARWPTERVPGGHLHQVVDPEGVTQVLLAMVERVRTQ